jgi:hypothetical protein
MDKVKILQAQGARLKAARLTAGYTSAHSAADQNPWAPSTYAAHESGARMMDYFDAERYARVFRLRGVAISGQEIIYGSKQPPSDGLAREAVVHAMVGTLVGLNALDAEAARACVEAALAVITEPTVPGVDLSLEKDIQVRASLEARKFKKK